MAKKKVSSSKVTSKKKSSKKKSARAKPRTVQAEIVDHKANTSANLSSANLSSANLSSTELSAHDAHLNTPRDPHTDESADTYIDDSAVEQLFDTDPELNLPQIASSRALAPSDPVALYLAEIRKYALLSREEEFEIAKKYFETGDPKAAEALVTANLRFVVKVAAEYAKFGAKLIDLIQEGNVGLMHAVKEYNPYKGVRLITYAVWWIRGYIQEYLMRQYSIVRIGTTQTQRKLFYKLQKEKEALDAMGDEPNVALLSSRLGVTEEDVRDMSQRLKGRDVSLNALVDEDSSTSLMDFQRNPNEVPMDEKMGLEQELEVLKKNVEKLLPTLNEKEQFILENRILAENPMNLQEIGDHYGTTREAVRQMEARVIKKIKDLVLQDLE